MGLFNKRNREKTLDVKKKDKEQYYDGLSRSRNSLKEGLLSLFGRKIKIDDAFLEEVERFLYESDFGSEVSDEVISRIQQISRKEDIIEMVQVQQIMSDIFSEWFQEDDLTVDLDSHHPSVILVVGVNGAGKTTTIGKLAAKYKEMGKDVLLVAGDTYRAAAVEQLAVWADRAKVDIIMNPDANNPSGVIFDGIKAGISRNKDVILVDTAGRLHNKQNLMNELDKIRRVIQKQIPDAPHETLLVLDGAIGQNSVVQAREFTKVTPINGLIISKLDGTAKGGSIMGIKQKLGIPVKYIGLGEGINDLIPFEPEKYVKALFHGFN